MLYSEKTRFVLKNKLMETLDKNYFLRRFMSIEMNYFIVKICYPFMYRTKPYNNSYREYNKTFNDINKPIHITISILI